MNRRTLTLAGTVALLPMAGPPVLAHESLRLALKDIESLYQRGRRDASDPNETPEAGESDRPSRDASEPTPTSPAASESGNQDSASFSFNDQTSEQIMYMGMLTTWYEMMTFILGEISKSVQSGSASDMIDGARSQSGATLMLSIDVTQFVAPSPYTAPHNHFADSVRLVNESLDDMLVGFLTNSQASLDRSSRKVRDANDSIDLFHETMPVQMPNRKIVED